MRVSLKKNKGKRGKVDNSRRLEAYESGVVPCQGCRHKFTMADVEPLQMVECPKCKAITFTPLRISRFWLFEPLGGGGMGSVYKACSTDAPKTLYAVKVLARSERTHAGNIHALLNEARIAGIIGDHRCLVKGIASGYEDGEYFAAMECVEGDRLDKLIDLTERMEEQDVLQIALHVLAAEQHIYNCGFLYRDLKPENVVIDNSGFAVLLDYGLCIPRQRALHPGDEYVSGSPYYLPPERLLGAGEDAFSEIYSLGMVMYYALTGQTFFDADEVEALAKRHVSKARIKVSSKMRNFRPELVNVMTKMIHKDPAQRYQTFKEAALAIKELLPQDKPEPQADAGNDKKSAA